MYKSRDVDLPDQDGNGYPSAERSGPGTMNPRATRLGATKAVATKLTMRPGMEAGFAQWQAAFTRAVSGAPDFVSLEIIPAYPGSSEWQVIQRFRSPEALVQWMQDESRVTLLAELAGLEGSGRSSQADEAAPDYHSTTTVTEVFNTVVKPGQEEAFRLWSERVQQVQARFPGYMGTLVQAPLSAEASYWTTLVRFESPARLEAWLESAARKAILLEATPQVSTWRHRRMSHAFSGWFADEQNQDPPPAWKQTCLVLLVLFPVVMLEIRFLSPLLSGLNVSVSTFIGNAISVSLVSWPLMAVAMFGMGWWLRPPLERRRRTELLGALAIAGLYAFEMIVFMRLV